MAYRIGIDVGGTFTDFLLARADGAIRLAKEPTTLPDQSEGVLRGLARLAAEEGLSLGALLEATDALVHGTTTADNAMIERNGATTGLVTSEGHRDEIEIRRGYKEEIWDPAFPPPAPIAPRRRRFGVPERLDARGRVVRPLDEAAVREAARRLRLQGVESVAVCLLFSFLDPAHERRAGEILREELPDARISLSHEVMPAGPEFERTSTTLVDAYVGPRVERYLRRLASELRAAGYRGELAIMQSNGGLITAPVLAKRAVAALGSGPTGGVVAACAVAARAGVADFVAVDMGGTSYEACLVRGGAPSVRSAWNWQHRHLVGLPMLEMHSIGAGGGSLARVEAGALRVGPESARAVPGPVCYGRGGTRTTVTDANLVLGYLSPKGLCGGDFELTSAGVREALARDVGEPLGLDPVAAAHGVVRIVDANMANAIRRVTSGSGVDPRGLCLVVYGGNGPLHAARQAEELGIARWLVPRSSPAFSALGLLLADPVVDVQRSHLVSAGRADPDELEGLFGALERGARAELAGAGVRAEALETRRFLLVCYPGQTFDLAVPAEGSGGRMDAAGLRAAIGRFHDLHEELHAYAVRDEEPVVRALRVQVTGRTPRPALPELAPARGPAAAALRSRRAACFGGGFVDTPVYDGERLGPGQRVAGPAIVEERFTAIVVPPGWATQLDRHGNHVVTREARATGARPGEAA